MKHFFSIIIGILVFGIFSCESDSARRDSNPFFEGQPGANFTLNLDNVTNANLKSPGGELFLSKNRALGSIQGVFIFSFNAMDYFVFDLAEPNHPIGNCLLTLDAATERPKFNQQGQLEYTCGEEKTFYDRFGQKVDGAEGFPLRSYNAVRSGNILRVSF